MATNRMLCKGWVSVLALTTLLFLAGIVLLPGLGPTYAEDRAEVQPDVGSAASAQTREATGGTWTSGAAEPTPVVGGAAAVLKNEIYVVGGLSASGVVSGVQIYNPTLNTWSTGASYPSSVMLASSAVVKNVLYVFGGTPDNQNASNAVSAYSPTTRKWTAKAAMPTARWGTSAVVANNIVYVIGGYNGSEFVATVESYNPAKDTWTEEAPMLVAKDGSAAGLFGSAGAGYTIVVADGAINGGGVTGDNEAYDPATNSWTALASDPNTRAWGCSGTIGTDLYAVGDYSGGGAGTTNESFSLSADKWTTTLAPIPQGTAFPASAVFKKRLYCIGGWGGNGGPFLDNVQIYQP